MAYTYQDFISRAKSAGLLDEFSDYDLAVAKEHPEFGLSILALKQDIHSAKTNEAKLLAHATAEELRHRYGSYSGGERGDDFILLPPDRESALTDLTDPPDFSYGRSGALADTFDSLSEETPFSYDLESDPVYASYRKQYLREADRAAENALAKASAATLGVPSSYAVTAASQAENEFAGKLADKIPELYRDAYERYADDKAHREKLAGLLLDDRDAAARLYSDALDQRKDAFSAVSQTEKSAEDAAESEAAAKQKLAAKQVDALLAVGETPPASLVKDSGYSEEYIRLMLAHYRKQKKSG